MSRKRGQKSEDVKLTEGAAKLRLDKWLWFARMFKTRSIATKLCQDSKVRVNGTLLAKPHYAVQIGDVLTFPKEKDIRVIKVLQLGARRGPAPEAQALYEDLAPPQPKATDKVWQDKRVAVREPGAGRPTKRERRATDSWREEDTLLGGSLQRR